MNKVSEEERWSKLEWVAHLGWLVLILAGAGFMTYVAFREAIWAGVIMLVGTLSGIIYGLTGKIRRIF